VNDDFLKTIWINRLPSYLQSHLIGQTDVSLDQQVSMADAIVDISNNRKPQITEISQTLNLNYLRKGNALETKLDLELTQIQLKMQNEITEIKSKNQLRV